MKVSKVENLVLSSSVASGSLSVAIGLYEIRFFKF